MSSAEPLMYSERAERYLRQRGTAYDDHTIAIGKLTPPQRRRSLRKERRGWRRIGLALHEACEYDSEEAEIAGDYADDGERCCGIDGLLVYVCVCDDSCECACPGCGCDG